MCLSSSNLLHPGVLSFIDFVKQSQGRKTCIPVIHALVLFFFSSSSFWFILIRLRYFSCSFTADIGLSLSLFLSHLILILLWLPFLCFPWISFIRFDLFFFFHPILFVFTTRRGIHSHFCCNSRWSLIKEKEEEKSQGPVTRQETVSDSVTKLSSQTREKEPHMPSSWVVDGKEEDQYTFSHMYMILVLTHVSESTTSSSSSWIELVFDIHVEMERKGSHTIHVWVECEWVWSQGKKNHQIVMSSRLRARGR